MCQPYHSKSHGGNALRFPLLTSKNRTPKTPSLKEEWDLVRGIWISPSRLGKQREGKGQDKAWWEVDSIVSGSYDGNTFVQRVLVHMSSQDEGPGGNPPTYGVSVPRQRPEMAFGPPGKTT